MRHALLGIALKEAERMYFVAGGSHGWCRAQSWLMTPPYQEINWPTVPCSQDTLGLRGRRRTRRLGPGCALGFRGGRGL